MLLLLYTFLSFLRIDVCCELLHCADTPLCCCAAIVHYTLAGFVIFRLYFDIEDSFLAKRVRSRVPSRMGTRIRFGEV